MLHSRQCGWDEVVFASLSTEFSIALALSDNLLTHLVQDVSE